MAARLVVVLICIRVQPNQVTLEVLCTLISIMLTQDDEEEIYLSTLRAGICAFFHLFSHCLPLQTSSCADHYFAVTKC